MTDVNFPNKEMYTEYEGENWSIFVRYDTGDNNAQDFYLVSKITGTKTAMQYPKLFKSRYPVLKGSDWIKTISPEDRIAFVQIGFKHSDYGRKGGIHRAKIGKRDKKGRFTKGETNVNKTN